MRRAFTLVTIFALATASAAWAAYSSLPVDDLMRPDPRMTTGVIEIRVPAEELSRCVATLVQVMQMPLDPALVTEVSDDMPATPGVRCVAE